VEKVWVSWGKSPSHVIWEQVPWKLGQEPELGGVEAEEVGVSKILEQGPEWLRGSGDSCQWERDLMKCDGKGETKAPKRWLH
jgi:hypothetical protein